MSYDRANKSMCDVIVATDRVGKSDTTFIFDGITAELTYKIQ